MNISDLITINANRYPNRNAVICGDDGRELTWREFNRMVSRLGNSLKKMGVEKGDRVGIYLPNCPEWLITFFGVMRIGAIALPFNILYKSGEISYILNDARVKLVVGAAREVKQNILNILETIPSVEKIVTLGETVAGAVDFYANISENSDILTGEDCHDDDVAAMLYTSGTTGQPKGVMLSHKNFMTKAALNSAALLLNEQDVFMTAAPYCHIFITVTLLGPFYTGAAVLSMSRFNPDKALELLSRYRVTHFAGVPTMYIFMLNSYSPKKYDLTAWRYKQTAGYSMPPELFNKIEQTFGPGLCEFYGSTETCATVTYNRLGHSKIGSIGPAAPGYSLKIADEQGNELPVGEVGEILVKGPGVFRGYWERPGATKDAFKDGYFCTGDLGCRDEEGYYYIVDRKKDLILNGGYNVYPREVEKILYQNDKILECAVIGEKDPDRGEVPVAFVVLKKDGQLSEADLIDFCKKNMASYKVPRYIKFIDEMPKNSTGKIMKRLLKEA
ncbi:long-chain-fatty-acid--CoA ligase [Pelotomaculum terephthalicicum JT]|uniref:class I adenylate-forming enzyme family protein n=1 Tax=Pelotomaculum TaxID=191373 RepID=UPI0009C5311F|nr:MULTISPECIES: long-chain-fatty-acid--CoA ligase [Pelotomaculum]MCG9967229.1 long-chain-fatty-acid--CoA ligase [Pelotomaculum terephthalicicum JT]OPX91144.1 MAG: Long-chain-fatty-acid--CoA ligase [Pelotomaculum sp. PtaB.Bin117]OPY61372.1 MAG: Long-chain-fatty-acid--CoA ligase [Pelotomaculum sp. PtaU1.Bin065]